MFHSEKSTDKYLDLILFWNRNFIEGQCDEVIKINGFLCQKSLPSSKEHGINATSGFSEYIGNSDEKFMDYCWKSVKDKHGYIKYHVTS